MVTVEAAHARAENSFQPKANRIGLWLFMLSETFLFTALVSARYVLDRFERPADLNQGLALAVTCVLLASSISAYLAETAIRFDRRKTAERFLWLTIGLGLLFMVGVVMEWNEMLGNFPPSTKYGSLFVTLIGFHAFHVLTGVIGLGIVVRLVRRGHYGSHDYWGLEGVVKYWHFVDLAWVLIYPTLYLVK